MASISDGGLSVPGNLNVFGDADVNGDVNIDGAAVIDGAASVGGDATITGDASANSLSLATVLLLTPTETAPTPPSEGMVYADTDHKLYFYNGTAWKEVTFA